MSRGTARKRASRGLIGALALVLLLPSVAAAEELGESNTITDVPGLKVGHETRVGDGYNTGTTVILAEDGATTSYSSKGGGPGTKETDLLEPGGLVTESQAVVLSGGSAYGLDSATGVMEWLEERDLGYPVGRGVVPIVPAAILYDLGRGEGEWDNRPDAEFGYAAADAATSDPVEIGKVGAGTGASVALGSASVELDNGYTVGAIVAANPGGSPIDPDTCMPLGERLEIGDEFNLRDATPGECPALRGGGSGQGASASEDSEGEPFNTTIAVVATDAPLDQTEAQRMAMKANTGLARSIQPVHNLFDGDTVFSMATGTPPSHDLSNGELGSIYQAASDALGRAVVHALLNDGSYCEEYPGVCKDSDGSGAQAHADDSAAFASFSGSTPAAGQGTGAGAVEAAAAGEGMTTVAALSLAAAAMAVAGTLLWVRRRELPGLSGAEEGGG